LNEEYASERDKLLELTNNQGIMTRPAWTLMHKFPIRGKKGADSPQSKSGVGHTLSTRSHSSVLKQVSSMIIIYVFNGPKGSKRFIECSSQVIEVVKCLACVDMIRIIKIFRIPAGYKLD